MVFVEISSSFFESTPTSCLARAAGAAIPGLNTEVTDPDLLSVPTNDGAIEMIEEEAMEETGDGARDERVSKGGS